MLRTGSKEIAPDGQGMVAAVSAGRRLCIWEIPAEIALLQT
jgi:hypothetical protein